jgi:hypothetical protein
VSIFLKINYLFPKEKALIITIIIIIKTPEKIAEELSLPNEKSDAKQEGIQHTKARLGEVLTFMNHASY